MPGEAVATLRRIYAAYEHGDFSLGPEICARDVVFIPASPGDHAVRGLENVPAYMREFLGQWDGFRVVAEEFDELPSSGDGEELVVVREHQYGSGAGSGIPVDQTFYAAWRFRDGLVRTVAWRTGRDAAVRAVQLAE
jgi:ketosteroid isomerase-like protein